MLRGRDDEIRSLSICTRLLRAISLKVTLTSVGSTVSRMASAAGVTELLEIIDDTDTARDKTPESRPKSPMDRTISDISWESTKRG